MQKPHKLFEDIYNETYDNLLKYVILKCHNLNDVNDIIQETYTELFKIMQKQEINDVTPFLFGIAKNKLKKYYSFTSKLKNILINKTIDDEEISYQLKSNYNLEDKILNKITEEEIWKYLNTKKTLTQKIFYLYYAEDITIKEIAQELNLKESIIKNHLYRTLKELHEIFRKEKY